MQKRLKTLLIWGVLLVFALSIAGMVAARQYHAPLLAQPTPLHLLHTNTIKTSSLLSTDRLRNRASEEAIQSSESNARSTLTHALITHLSLLGKDERAFAVTWEATPFIAYTTGWANIRSSPHGDGSLLGTAAPDTTLTIYGTIRGDTLSNTTTWYRVSDQQSTPQYVYSELVSTTPPAQSSWNPVNTLSVPDTGKIIIINVTNQWLYAYQDGQQVTSSAITTGRPGLDTPIGTFQVINKESPTTFYSIWPQGSPYYFPPTRIQFALEFLGSGYFIHDAFWRNDYGPGSNVPHYIPGYGTELGSHGCVNVPYSTMSWLYNWADLGTTVEITY
ncbi:L,D-transpeptidase family protein [Dictyobacter formicarum]|uniref:L,D-TPase catalytic domain-containing protein n=1 Tax=Dictyobacter formicarum TaxID=2778368 RepID=A0ABQ3VIS2_9CHLR|nr:L,D-transpeptidase family protein [Dictyobacter formicarum]GHO85376.1 hypothetical protein KSZ_33820 [Dictyobacter formicarum]